jgi:hypothetical protein
MKTSFTLLAALIGFASSALTAHADIIWYTGNVPQPDENVLLNSGLTGPLITGMLNQSGGIVNFSSASGDLTSPSSGQARIEPAAGNDPFNSLTFWLADGATFTSAIFNLPGDSGWIDIAVAAGSGLEMQSFETDSGENFFTIVAVNGDFISSITLSTLTGSFSDMRQIRIGGYTPAANVPDSGTSVALVGVGLLALAGLRRKFRA